MKVPKLNKDQIQKIALSSMGAIFLLYVYFNFFLGPLTRSRDAMLREIQDKQGKLERSKSDLAKATTLEKEALHATSRFAALKALSPEGAPIAWFPPRMKLFFANQHVDKAGARLENTASFKQPELSNWTRYNWLFDLPQADYEALGKAISQLENTEPLLSITKLSIRTTADQPQFQQVTLAASTYVPKS